MYSANLTALSCPLTVLHALLFSLLDLYACICIYWLAIVSGLLCPHRRHAHRSWFTRHLSANPPVRKSVVATPRRAVPCSTASQRRAIFSPLHRPSIRYWRKKQNESLLGDRGELRFTWRSCGSERRGAVGGRVYKHRVDVGMVPGWTCIS